MSVMVAAKRKCFSRRQVGATACIQRAHYSFRLGLPGSNDSIPAHRVIHFAIILGRTGSPNPFAVFVARYLSRMLKQEAWLQGLVLTRTKRLEG